jgi:transposase-like protein
LYDKKFKLEAVRMVLEKDNGVRETARLLEISRATLAGWMRELKIQHRTVIAARCGLSTRLLKEPSWPTARCWLCQTLRWNHTELP